jgi:hypothetical protein
VRAISPAAVEIVRVISATPNKHFTTSPYCGLILSGGGRVNDDGPRPTIGAGIVSPTGVQVVVARIIKGPSPNDHFAASPYCGVRVSANWCIRSTGSYPTIRPRIVSAAIIRTVSTPDDHFTAGPHCRVLVCGRWRVGSSGGRPIVRGGSIPSASIQTTVATVAAPHNHFTARPYRRRSVSTGGRVGCAGR